MATDSAIQRATAANLSKGSVGTGLAPAGGSGAPQSVDTDGDPGYTGDGSSRDARADELPPRAPFAGVGERGIAPPLVAVACDRVREPCVADGGRVPVAQLSPGGLS